MRYIENITYSIHNVLELSVQLSEKKITVANDLLESLKINIGEETEFLSGEDFFVYFNRVLCSEKPSLGIYFLEYIGILSHYIPELSDCKGVKQNSRYHIDDVFTHCLKVCDETPCNLTLRWAGLLHDIGKKKAYKEVNGFITFHKHEVYSTNLCKNIMKRLEVKSNLADKILKLISLHMYHYTGDCWAIVDDKGEELPSTRSYNKEELDEMCRVLKDESNLLVEVKCVEKGWKDTTVKRFMEKADITKEKLKNVEDIELFQLRAADRLSRGLKGVSEKQKDFQDRLRKQIDK